MLKNAWHRLAVALLLGSTSAVALAYTPAKWNLPEGVTEISHEVHDLHMMMFWVCVAIGVVVFGVMFYSVFAHRRSKHPKPADFHESTLVEILWTGAPFIILIAMAIPAAATLIRMDDMRGSEMSVKITGYQWKWQYEYLDTGVSFYSTLAAESNRARQTGSGVDVTQVENYLVDVDKPLVLPVGRKIRFLITSNDVIHAWWVSELAVKKDAIPGYVNEVWTKIDQPGTYRGVCAELCGRDHGFMPIVVKAVPAEEYEAWVAQQKNGGVQVASAEPASLVDIGAPASIPEDVSGTTQVAEASIAAEQAAAPSGEALLAKGKDVYGANCAACHQATGTGAPPTFPALVGSKVANGPADAAITQVLKGKAMMPPLPHLSDADIAAALSYVRSSWGNTGSAVTPDQVKALR